MFEWLDEEIARIKTHKFYLVDGPASAELRQAVEACDLPVPTSYKEFVLRFGNAKLYRCGSYYHVTILAAPRDSATKDGESYLQIGGTSSSTAFFKVNLLRSGQDTPVFESYDKSFRKTADSFEEWLAAKCKAARKRFKKAEWEAIEIGPPPFNQEELAIVEARKLFQWRVVGIAPNEDLRFEIYNGSNITLPYLSVGIRGKLRPPNTGPLHGGAFLPVASILPGQTKIVEFACYKNTFPPKTPKLSTSLIPDQKIETNIGSSKNPKTSSNNFQENCMDF